MKCGLGLTLVMLAAALHVHAQSPGMQATDISSGVVSPNAARLLDKITPTNPQETHSFSIFKKPFKITGPLVYPFKGRGIAEAPKRFLHLINPFAKVEHAPESEAAPRMSTAAWSTVAGWSPGHSAFSDAVSHESTMGISFSGGR